VTSDSTTLRSRFGIALVIVLWVVLAAIFISLIVQFQPLALLRFTPVIAFVAYAVWILMWSPSVTIAPSGVTIRNLLRTHDVSWPAIERIDTRFALTLYTTAGKIVAWSAPAPSRFAALRTTRTNANKYLPESTYVGGAIRPGDIPQSDSGLAALHVRRYWEQLRDAGYLDSGVVEGTGVVTTWLVRESVILLGLLVISLGTIALLPAK
jgi:Bacterial PH domain